VFINLFISMPHMTWSIHICFDWLFYLYIICWCFGNTVTQSC